jgi:hypothetical protein
MRLMPFIFVILIWFACSVGTSAQDIYLDTITILKIAAQERMAVIKVAEGTLQIVKPGEALQVAGHEWRVVEITEGRVVMEVVKEQRVETVIFRIEGGRQTIQRLRKSSEGQRNLYLPKEWPEGMSSK